MPIKYVEGDIFDNIYGVQAFAHGCNCKGAMGKGIAVKFKLEYPQMYEEYKKKCKTSPKEFNIGDVFLWKEKGKPYVFNLATQEDYWRSKATYLAIEKTLTLMRQIAELEKVVSIAIPSIGAGYGGLSWNKVKVILETVFSDWDGTLYVYENYISNPER